MSLTPPSPPPSTCERGPHVSRTKAKVNSVNQEWVKNMAKAVDDRAPHYSFIDNIAKGNVYNQNSSNRTGSSKKKRPCNELSQKRPTRNNRVVRHTRKPSPNVFHIQNNHLN